MGVREMFPGRHPGPAIRVPETSVLLWHSCQLLGPLEPRRRQLLGGPLLGVQFKRSGVEELGNGAHSEKEPPLNLGKFDEPILPVELTGRIVFGIAGAERRGGWMVTCRALLLRLTRALRAAFLPESAKE